MGDVGRRLAEIWRVLKLGGLFASEYWIVCRVPVMSRQSYLPLLLVRAFGHRFRLGLSVAPPFGFGVPH